MTERASQSGAPVAARAGKGGAEKDGSMPILENLTDPHDCEHEWQPVSMVFETQLLDPDGRVMVRQPDLDQGRLYLVCLLCAQHTYMTTNWIGYFLGGSTTRGFKYNPNSSHAYSLDGGQTWRPEKPTADELADDEDEELDE